MRQRQRAGKPAEITFTCDYHALVAGDLRPGGSLLLRYDPHRIVPPGEPYRFGEPERPVTAQVQFHHGAPPLDVVLRSPAGTIPCPDVDPTGQGSMLSATLTVPDDADLLIAWFRYDCADGTAVYDSDHGANYRFGFPSREIDVVEAIVTARADGMGDRFHLVVRTAPRVEDVAARFVLLADPACARHEVRLQPVGPDGTRPDAVLWSGDADVPHPSIVRFKVCYWIGGRRLVDDDAGAWYLAPEAPPDQPPPPSAALLAAAAAWA